jgi:GDP-4-dehydro-6-deoxy-D-mannose reductase
MKALVTGAAGFVGKHLCRHLQAEGDEVVGIDREHGPDLLDPEGMVERFGAVRPDAVYHLGGWSDVGASWDDPLGAFRANAEGTLNVLQAARRAGVARVLVVSSADVYGPVEPERLPITENFELCPLSPYAASKAAADQLCVQAWKGYSLPVMRARAFNHLGTGQTTRFVAPAIAQRIARNERDGGDEVPIGNVDTRRDVTDVRDVVRAYRLLVQRGEAGEAYNVCSGLDLSIGELGEQLIALAARPMRLVADPALRRAVETPVLRGDPGKLTAATGWVPTIPLEQTLADVLAEQRAVTGR